MAKHLVVSAILYASLGSDAPVPTERSVVNLSGKTLRALRLASSDFPELVGQREKEFLAILRSQSMQNYHYSILWFEDESYGVFISPADVGVRDGGAQYVIDKTARKIRSVALEPHSSLPKLQRVSSHIILKGSVASALLLVHQEVANNRTLSPTKDAADIYSFRFYRSGDRYRIEVFSTPTDSWTYLVDKAGKSVVQRPGVPAGVSP